jgi:drug/metabolite transporter (DMT)-like permease
VVRAARSGNQHGENMNPNRPVWVALVIMGILLIVTALGAQPPRKVALVMGIGFILVAVVLALRAR